MGFLVVWESCKDGFGDVRSMKTVFFFYFSAQNAFLYDSQWMKLLLNIIEYTFYVRPVFGHN